MEPEEDILLKLTMPGQTLRPRPAIPSQQPQATPAPKPAAPITNPAPSIQQSQKPEEDILLKLTMPGQQLRRQFVPQQTTQDSIQKKVEISSPQPITKPTESKPLTAQELPEKEEINVNPTQAEYASKQEEPQNKVQSGQEELLLKLTMPGKELYTPQPMQQSSTKDYSQPSADTEALFERSISKYQDPMGSVAPERDDPVPHSNNFNPNFVNRVESFALNLLSSDLGRKRK